MNVHAALAPLAIFYLVAVNINITPSLIKQCRTETNCFMCIYHITMVVIDSWGWYSHLFSFMCCTFGHLKQHTVTSLPEYQCSIRCRPHAVTKCLTMYVVKCLDNVASQYSSTTTIFVREASGSNSIFTLAQSMALKPTLLLTKQCRTQTDSYYI